MDKPIDKRGIPWHGFTVGRRRFGWEHSTIKIAGQPYLERWILYIGGITLRLHKFWSGDDDRAPHDHPFWFITFPFTSYFERVFDPAAPGGPRSFVRRVKAFRFNYRPATFRHIVLGSSRGVSRTAVYYDTPKPFYTFCIAGFVGRAWGFWPEPNRFVYWRDWENDSSY